MKIQMLMVSALLSSSIAVFAQTGGQERVNPFLTEFNTPYGVPPFDQITIQDYREGT